MAKVDPFYSIKPDTNVHHNNDECELGNNIEPENRRSGTGGHPLCSRCEELS